jgi:hypothetical protein
MSGPAIHAEYEAVLLGSNLEGLLELVKRSGFEGVVRNWIFNRTEENSLAGPFSTGKVKYVANFEACISKVNALICTNGKKNDSRVISV